MKRADMADKLIIGAGLYGLYAALHCARRGQRVTVLELDEQPFSRATYVNQARVHMGYHYPRSLSTAMKSAGYFKRFVEDYSFCIRSDFQQVYATSSHFSWTDAAEFAKFCRDAGIPCEALPVEKYFREGVCDGAFMTREYTYDAQILRDYFLEELKGCSGAELLCGREIRRIVKRTEDYEIYAFHQGREERYRAPFVLNASYASVNQVLSLVEGESSPGRPMERETFGIKYELCEIILCRVNDALKDLGVTVMDGPFFSIMPFGKTGFHSLTSVTFTPHRTSFGTVPQFPCMEGGRCAEAGESGTAYGGEDKAADRMGEGKATDMTGEGKTADRTGERKAADMTGEGKIADIPEGKAAGVKGNCMGDSEAGRRGKPAWLGNCNLCGNKPESAWEYMSALARKYMREEYQFSYEKSLFSMKPILRAAEIDDSRPTVIRFASRKPDFVSVLSGKINTLYDLDEVLDEP